MRNSETISEARQRLLEKIQRGQWQASSAAREPAIPRTPGHQGPPSPGQEQIWFHAQLAGDAPVYNESVTIHRRGPLDRAVLERCLNEMARRHELWRSAFPIIDGKVVQQVERDFHVALPFDDLSSLSAEQRENESQRLATEDVRRPFDLNHAPLIRWRLVRWSEDYHRLYLTLHHLMFDGVSVYRVMISELGALYQAYSNGQPSPLPELALQYRDYAAWKRQMAGGNQEAQMKYWRETIGENPPTLQLPTDRPRPAARTWRGGMETCVIPAALIDGIKALARSEGVTPYMVLLAVFQVLLYRYSGQDEVIVGGATNTRTRPELEPLLGYFLNAVVYRTHVDGDGSFRDFLAAVKTTVLGALANSDVPFDAIVRDLAPQRDPSRHPFFQVLFSMRPPFEEFPDGWDVTDMEAHSAATGWDLFVEFSEHPEALAGRFVYSTELFDRATILRMQTHFEELLRNLLADPDQALSQATLLSEPERRMLLEDWNDTAKSFPKRLLHELFEEQAERNGRREALVFRGKRIAYAELNARANQLAHLLRRLGAGRGSFIGLFLERSPEMVVALLAVSKSGAAYVPYDTELPASRLKMLLEDTRPVCVLTQHHLAVKLADWAGETIVLDAARQDLDTQPASNPGIAIESTDAIYAIYTSGSTGMPKAAVNTHEAVANRIFWMQAEYGLETRDRVLQKTPYSFDVSVWEFFWPLACGATLVIAEPGGHRDADYLAGLIHAERITTLHFVPSMLREFLDVENLHRCASIRRVFSSGEALPQDLRQKFYDRLSAELHNLYGPTEAAVDVTYWDCRRKAPCATVPIGRPIANVTAYILDRHLQAVPIGVAGELYIGGIAVGRGYLNRPELTEERFIPDPFARKTGARLYKTGDRARFLPDGNIEYLGRNDNQVKLRGFRIELGEVESAILAHAQVRAAAVVLHQDRGGAQLIAYVVPAGPALEALELKAFLREHLPDYMTPARVFFLDSLPLLSNGKLNRNALPAPEHTESRPTRARATPRNSIEKKLARIWEDLLEQQPVGIDQSFFDLGGHSLLLIRMIAQVQKKLGHKLSVATVLASPTIETLAAVIAGRKASAAICRVTPLKPQGTRPPFICLGASPLFLPFARLLGTDQPFCGFDLDQLPKVELPNPCRLEDLAAHVVAGIREYQPRGPYYIGGWCLFGVLAYETARQLTAQGERVELLTLFDTRNTAYPKTLSAWERLRMGVQKALFHLQNLAAGSPSEKARYFIEHVKILRGKIKEHRQQLTQGRTPESAGDWEINEKMMDINPIVVRAACQYDTPPYAGRVLVVQGTDVPKGHHWQMAVQWKQPLAGEWTVYQVQGSHDGMFKFPHVEQLAVKIKASFEQLDKEHQRAENGQVAEVWSSQAAPVAVRSSATK